MTETSLADANPTTTNGGRLMKHAYRGVDIAYVAIRTGLASALDQRIARFMAKRFREHG